MIDLNKKKHKGETHMKKKSLLLSLACAMLILLFGMTANAQSEDTLEPYSYTNPAYANLESGDVSDNIAPYSMEDTPNISYTDDVDALASTLRQQMVSRAAVINLYYHHDSVLTQAVFDQLCDDLFAKAIAHTGVGKAGVRIISRTMSSSFLLSI